MVPGAVGRGNTDCKGHKELGGSDGNVQDRPYPNPLSYTLKIIQLIVSE